MTKHIEIVPSTTSNRTLMWTSYSNGKIPQRGKEAKCFEALMKWCDLYSGTKLPKNVAEQSLASIMVATPDAKATKAHFYIEWGIRSGLLKIV